MGEELSEKKKRTSMQNNARFGKTGGFVFAVIVGWCLMTAAPAIGGADDAVDEGLDFSGPSGSG